MCWLQCRKCSTEGYLKEFRKEKAYTRETPPAPASACPTMDLLHNMDINVCSSEKNPRALRAADISIGSPKLVPVPCKNIFPPKEPQVWIADWIKAFWARPFGAVKDADMPSCPTSEASTKHKQFFPAESLSKVTIPTESLLT